MGHSQGNRLARHFPSISLFFLVKFSLYIHLTSGTLALIAAGKNAVLIKLDCFINSSMHFAIRVLTFSIEIANFLKRLGLGRKEIEFLCRGFGFCDWISKQNLMSIC